MKRICVWVLLSVLLGLSPAAFAKTHREMYQVSCDQLWVAVKDVVRNSGKYGIIGIDANEMSISYNIGGALGGKRINSVVLNRKGDAACEMQTQTAYSGMIHNDAGDFKDRVEKALAAQRQQAESAPKKPVNAAKKEVVEEKPSTPAAATAPAPPAGPVPTPDKGVVGLTSNIEGVEISVDGAVVGKTPARLSLAPGKHKIRGQAEGYDAWEKEIEVLAESEMNLKMVLKKPI